MDKVREVIAYKHYFEEFLRQQNTPQKEIDKAIRLMKLYYDEKAKNDGN